jgi:hypothetical protein
VNTPESEISRLEQLAEASYTKMYDAPRHGVRDHYEDASSYLAQAIALATREEMPEAVERLKARKAHIYIVYTHQFR